MTGGTPSPTTGRGVSDTAKAFAARARRRRWTSARPLLVAGACAALAAVLAWVVLGTSVLGVRRVVVTGTSRLTAARVLAAADVPRGHPLATLDLGAIGSRVAALAPVRSVRVVRAWPSTIRVQVTERTPVAVVEGGGRYQLVDRSGVPFWPAQGRRAGLPLIRVATPDRGDRATIAALRVLRALPESVRSRVDRVSAPTPAAVTLRLRGGKTVVWGTAAASRRKAAVLAALLRRPGRVYDVSVPNVATVR